MLNKIRKDLENFRNDEKAKILRKFFKTRKGEYGHGDVFLGITVPKQREIAKKYINLSFNDLKNLISGKIHEHRLISLLILIEKYKKEYNKKEIVDFYLNNLKCVNNWDLVDLSADKILGSYLIDKNKDVLYGLAKSSNLWERRISIVSTFALIKNNRYDDALKISRMLLNDEHDLIHKAVGWMLREIGKRNQNIEEDFLKKYYKNMPRTMLRYAIEKFDDKKRKFYLSKPKSF